MDNNMRPADMKRIDTPALAEAFIADQVAAVRAQVGDKVQEPVRGVHIDEVRIHLIPEHLDHLLALTLAHKAVVHVDADQLFADGLDEQRRHHRGVHAAGEGQQYLLVPHLGADGRYLVRNKGLRQSGGIDPLPGAHAFYEHLGYQKLSFWFRKRI